MPPPTVWRGECVAVMAGMPDNSVDAIVTDPPYDLTSGKRGGSGVASVDLDSPYGRSRIGTGNGSGGFMGKAWDSTGVAFDPATWRECLRVLKPGGHLLAFGATRTSHRLAVAIEDAGFDIRDTIAWIYGSGFPKSLDVSKAFDKAAGVERPIYERPAFGASFSDDGGTTYGTAIEKTPITDAAKQWDGWGTALKPAHEPIIMARKPFRGTVAQNVAEYGTGAINVDGCRIEGEVPQVLQGGRKINGGRYNDSSEGDIRATLSQPHPAGRWPANVAFDEDAAVELDQQSGTASRFFYCSKAGARERVSFNGTNHPTVKPLDLIRWLVRMVTPPGGIVLDPFAGSGTTVEAAIMEGFDCIAIEREISYLPLIWARVARARNIPLRDDDDGE